MRNHYSRNECLVSLCLCGYQNRKAQTRKRIIVKSLLIILTVSILFTGCSDKDEKCAYIPDTDGVEVSLTFETYSDSLINLTSKDKLVKLLSRNAVMRDLLFRREEYPNDSVFVNTLYERFTNPHIDTLRMEVARVFGAEQGLKEEFTQAFKNLKHYYPEARTPKIQTVITGLDNDMVVTDSLIIISLDFFLGPKAKYRSNMYDYLLRQYVKENVVPACMLLYGIDSKYNQTNPADKTVLADMITYGKAYYFAKHMVPCTPDSVFIWYTAEEIEGSIKNQDLIWARFIEDQILYSTNHMVKQKFLGERPKTIEVGEKCPGRIAQWVGWEIVKSYMKSHPEVTLPQLMQYESADKLFKESKYKPVRK
jgi:hypothetical protein